LTGKETCKKFLERTVDQLWAEIAAHLKTVDRFSLIRAALQNNEAILRDREHWSNTARALIAIHEDKEDVRAVAHKRETERIRASLAGRVLIEMAICVAMNAGAGASKSDYDSLIARVISLIETAHVRDAMRYDLCPSRLEIHPNGFIGIDNNLIEDAVRKYNSESFGEQFRQASARYEHLYQIKEQRRDLQEIYSPEFLLAFEAEYGLTLERYIDVIAELWQVGVDLKECVVSMETPSLIERLLRREISDVDAMQFLNSFALQPRPKWEEVERPFRKQDFYPWRYQRRLSLTMRPIVWDGNVNRGQIIYGLQALVVSMSYLLGNIELGWLQQDNATSAEMKKLIGGISDTKGKEFEDEVSNRLQSSEWNTKVRIRLSSMGGPEELGDVDVFAWNKNNQRILAIECKRLKAARTVGEVGEQLKEFQGEARDRLGRHFQRIEWLNSNSKQAAAYLGIPFEDCLFSPLLVTNTIVPMQFKAGLPLKTEDIITLDSLIAN